jgi:membrane-bound lytic murein transglycosylase B
VDVLRDYTASRRAADSAAVRSYDEVQALTAAKATADGLVGPAEATLVAATKALAERHNLLTVIEDATSIPGTDVPLMVLDAYQRAAAAVRSAGCAMGWWVLAGVGKVESDHGRMQHARLTATGDLVPHIRGIPLDGSQNTQRVAGSGGSTVEAEGPMQFIPSTWSLAGRDGNADGKVDVDNIYDAALGAAVYLCESSGDLSSDQGLAAAYLAYNHSDSYAAEVLAYARGYEAADAAGRIPPPSATPLYQLAPPPTHL